MIDLKKFYFQNVQESDYHYKFYDIIKNVNVGYNVFNGYEERDDYEFEVYDTEEAISKFRELCQPEKSFFDKESKCWFYLISFYLYKVGYVIKEFPWILARPPIDPDDFTYGEIQNRLIAQGNDVNGVVRYATRRVFVASLTFESNPNCGTLVSVGDDINQKFVEISNRKASLDNMSTDEKLSEIANMIEYLLKKGDKFLELDYSEMTFGFLSDAIVKKYRKQIQCFRHASENSVEERKKYSNAQKDFLINFGLTIVNVTVSLLKQI